jgi:lysophospholipase L1-like esterase
MASLYVQGGDPSRVYYGTDTRAQAMLIGAALAVVVTLHGPLRSRAARSVLSVAATLGFVVVVLPWFASNATRVHDVFYGRFGLLAYSCATAIVIWRLAQPSSGVLGRALELSPVIWVGAISYEMYLWHWPVYLVITPDRTGVSGVPLLFLRLASVVAVAAVTHFFVGEPIRRGVRLRSPKVAGIATAAVVIAVSVGVFAATVSARPVLSGNVGQVADRRGPPPATTPSASATPLKVLVVGDSQAATLAQGLDAAPGQTGLSAQPGLVVWNRAILGCSIITVDTFVIDGNREQNKCGGAGAWQQQWAKDVAAFTPDVVVAQAGAWDLFDVAGPDGAVIHPGDPNWTTGYTRDVELLFDTVTAKGAAIVAVRPPCYGANEVVGGSATPPIRLDAARINAVAAVWERVARARGIGLLDLNSTLCPGGVADASIRPDGAHFSNDGANRTAPIVAKAVRAAASTQAFVGG